MYKSLAVSLSRFFFESSISLYIQVALGLYLCYAFFHAFFNIFEIRQAAEVLESVQDDCILEEGDQQSKQAGFNALAPVKADDMPHASADMSPENVSKDTLNKDESAFEDLSAQDGESPGRDDSFEKDESPKDARPETIAENSSMTTTPQGWISVEDFTRRLRDFQEKLNSMNVNTLKNVCSNFPVLGNRKQRKNMEAGLFSDIEMFASLLSDSTLPDHFIRQSMGFLADMEGVIKKQNYRKALELLDVFFEEFANQKSSAGQMVDTDKKDTADPLSAKEDE